MVLTDTAESHIVISGRMLEHADRFVREGDLIQASEKGWGAAAHYLKAVAKQRGWRNGTHGDFFVIKDRLTREVDDPDRFTELFRTVRGLHTNFYEPWYSTDDVIQSIAAAREFIDMLEQAGVLDR